MVGAPVNEPPNLIEQVQADRDTLPSLFAQAEAVEAEDAIAGQLVSAAPTRAEIRLSCLCYAVELYRVETGLDVLGSAKAWSAWIEEALDQP